MVMNRVFIRLAIMLSIILSTLNVMAKQNKSHEQLTSLFIGDWQVSLYFSPGAPPSTTSMTIETINDDGTLVGSFYQTPFEHGRFTIRNEQLIFVVLTSDNSGIYSTSGRMNLSGTIEGQTLSIGRNFLMPWTAIRD